MSSHLAVPAPSLGIGRWLRPSVLAVLTVALVCVPQQPSELDAAVHVTAADLAACALVGAAFVTALKDRRRLSGRVHVLALPALGVAAATIASADVVASVSGFVRYFEIFILIPLAVAIVIRDELDRRLIAGALLAAAVVQAVLGCWQSYSGTGASYGGQNIRAVGTFGAVDVMGMSTVVSYGMIVALAVALSARGWLRASALVTLAVLVTALVLSLSRGAWLACFMAGLVMIFLSGWRRGLAICTAGVLVAVVVLGSGFGTATLQQRVASIGSVSTEPDQSVTDRYGLWETAASIWRDHPILGVGPRGFAAFRDSHAPLQVSASSDTADSVNGFQRQELLSPHNMYLLVLSEQGLIGLSAFVLLWGALAVWSWQNARRGTHRMAGLCAAGFLTWQLTDFVYADIGGAPTIIMSIVLGLLVSWAISARSGYTEAAPTA